MEKLIGPGQWARTVVGLGLGVLGTWPLVAPAWYWNLGRWLCVWIIRAGTGGAQMVLLRDIPTKGGCGFPGGTEVKKRPATAGDARDTNLIPGSARYPRVGNGIPLQYSCLENPMDRGAWRATVHRVAKNQAQLSTHYY